ncbi:S8 family serine peptidase [Phycicoccus sp. Root101]|uniref:S8 family peptidase n=1 Tax=Phycicoccus sp. Root101 TaxID=1736421 RepID=UPI0007037036|nr:S8 family serine peptidase [Phycicoccus sp. Root101]KQU66462.1 hypothetical protein ASC58_15635 [Phycicoccus sp. Root101]
MNRPTRSVVRTSLVAVVAAALVALPGLAGAGSPLASSAEAANPTPWWPAAMGFDDLAAAGAKGKGVTVAVIDGTIDPDAADVKGRIASVFTPCTAPATAADADADHATEIAQVIVGTGARSGGTPGVRGIAPEVTLRHYSIGTGEKNLCGVKDDGDKRSPLLIAMEKALADGARIVNLSFGSSSTSGDEKRAILLAQHAGAIVVAATGDGAVSFPAAYNGVVAVNACDSKAQLDPRGANDIGYGIAFCAPGVGLVLGEHRGGTWVAQGKLVDGTSFAAPLVAGGLAAYWSKYPGATADQVLQAALKNPGMKQGTSNSGAKGWIAAYRRVGSGFPKIQDSTRTGFGWGIFAPADAVRVDPTSYPDTNPLLRTANGLGPTAEEVASGVLADDATSSPSSTASPSSSASSSTSSSTSSAPAGTSGKDGSATAQPSGDGGGVPAWVWVVVLVVVLAAGTAFVVSRKGAARPAAAQPGEGS